MLDYNKIAIIVSPRAIHRHIIGSRKDDNALPRRVDRCAESVGEFHPVMRITLAILCGGVGITSIHRIIVGIKNGEPKEKVSVGDTEVRGARVARNLSRGGSRSGK